MNPRHSFLFAIVVALSTRATAAESLSQRLATARPGETIELPAGELKGSLTVPPGVSLKGAGFAKTIVDASGHLNGIVVEGGSNASVSDLTVCGAQGAGITVRDAKLFTLARVRVTKSAQAVAFKNAPQGRIENCLVDHDSFGIAVSGSANCAVVNCTVAACSEIALSLAACPHAVAFNNCLVGSATCINIDSPKDMHLDHNLYFGMYLGQMKEQIGKRIMTAWNYLTGLDLHSVQMLVEFKSLDAGDCTPTTILSWALDRAATGDWGIAELAGVKAPEIDMLGHPRVGRPDIGAVEVTVTPPRAADGQFTVSSDVGLKSAGVFTKDGILISYLFQNLPLPKGTYSFWLPARDYVGQPIPAGDYDVRLAESDFRWKYLNHVGDNGEDWPMARTASFNPAFVAFAPGGLLVMQEHISEDHTNVRAYDATTGKLRWLLHGGNNAQGIAVDSHHVYALCNHNPQRNESKLTRMDLATGNVVPWPGQLGGHIYPVIHPKAKSLAVLGDRLYAADAEGGKLVILDKSTGTILSTLPVPSPQYVAADDKNNLLWVISEGSLVALKPDGTKVASSKPVADPVAVATRDGHVAVASEKTGKIHVLDATDPQELKKIREYGRGDGPYGAIEPDRFLFQKASTWNDQEKLAASVALGPQGQFAVVDYRRTLMFDTLGKNLWYTIGVFGNQSKPSFSTDNRRMWDTQCELSFLLDERDGTWKPEAIWDHSALTRGGLQERICTPLGDFSIGEKTFFVSVCCTPGVPYGPPLGYNEIPRLIVARLDGFKSIPVMIVTDEEGKAVLREDTNGDGLATQADEGHVLTDAEGKPMSAALFYRFNYLEPDGSIIAMSTPPVIWKCAGLNSKGVPVYEGKNYHGLLDKDWKQDLSPYDLKPDYTDLKEGHAFTVAGLLSDGGRVYQAMLRNSGGAYLNNGGGTDLCAYSADGRRRWVLPLAQYKGICGMGTVDDITLTAFYSSIETLAVDADGLQLGGFCEPEQLHYCGIWLDHPNLRLFKMPDGHLHLEYGDNCHGRHCWYRLDNQESLKRTKQPFHVNSERSHELAALEWKPSKVAGRPSSPRIHLKKLKQPLKIDGGLSKWRDAGIEPQIVIGPSGSFDGPGDNSAVIRMAYEGQDLYFQILQFDDVPIFYQMVEQNSVEFTLNQAAEHGFQFVVYKTPDGKDLLWRNRFFGKVPQIFLEPSHAPRLVKVLPNAEDVPERKVLESLYGVDLSQAKVVVTEFKLPIDKTTYAGAEEDAFPLGPGKSFWVGFYVDDSDQMYVDDQERVIWPATFGVFSPLEDGAMAVCD